MRTCRLENTNCFGTFYFELGLVIAYLLGYHSFIQNKRKDIKKDRYPINTLIAYELEEIKNWLRDLIRDEKGGSDLIQLGFLGICHIRSYYSEPLRVY